MVTSTRGRLAVAVPIAALPIGLVLMQNDLGSAAVIGVCVGAILLVAGIRVRHAVVLLLLAVTAVGAVLAYSGTLDTYKIDRISSFLDQSTDTPASEQTQAQYNLEQAKSAIVTGGSKAPGCSTAR